MPVTFYPAKHRAESRDVDPVDSTDILRVACPNQSKQVDEILQCSVGGGLEPAGAAYKIVPNTNGFVNTVVTAWSRHHALVIRPDDVWLAIIAQFSFYVNANAELLRANFVSHEGKKELKIKGPPDFAFLSEQMGEMIHKNVVDPTLREWVLPKFSTTTPIDTTIGSMLMMATMKKYFDYTMEISCGIPRVTLEGERQDWEQLLHRLEKLKEYGLQTIAWYHLLVPVISQFVKAFDEPNSVENRDFWLKVACDERLAYGSPGWSGWITAFCVFSEQGRWRGPTLNIQRPQSRAPESMSSRRFWSSYTRPLQESRPHLTLGRTEYPVIKESEVPAGYAEVDVVVDDRPCVIVAGLVGMGFSSSRDLSVSQTGKNDTVRPVLAWWIYTKLEDEDKKPRHKGRHRSASSGSRHGNVTSWSPPSIPLFLRGETESMTRVVTEKPQAWQYGQGMSSAWAASAVQSRQPARLGPQPVPILASPVMIFPPNELIARRIAEQSRESRQSQYEQRPSSTRTRTAAVLPSSSRHGRQRSAVVEQSRENWQPEYSFPQIASTRAPSALGSSSRHGRRRSESAVVIPMEPPVIPPEPAPLVRKRRHSFLQRLFKFGEK
ncbi:hypothetical protein K438DRAFT_1823464 [Mycena galopus ATCC 62051]|nr:hypothetical protein K438DRAFT_1823464 [Mycena galopus ATCC 62051]